MFKFASKLNVFKTPQVKDVETVLDFASKDVLGSILTRSDKELGGYSTVNFDYVPEEKACRFHGDLSLDPPVSRPDVLLSGYAMFRSRDQGQNLMLTDNFWDWGNYNQLALRVKGDNRKYFVNLQADSSLTTDIFQHRLFLNRPGEWETVLVSLDDFVLTNWGNIQDKSGLDKSRVKTVGIGLLDRQFGPYSLDIKWIKVLTGESLAKEIDKERNSKSNEQKELDPFEDALV